MVAEFYKVKYKIISLARILLVKLAGVFKSYSLENSRMIFGEPRSGSTWLMELLASNSKCMVVWEPMHPLRGLKVGTLAQASRIFEDPITHNSVLKNHLTNVLTLKIFNGWTLNYTTLKTILYGEFTLTKFVRGTLLLPWISTNLQLVNKPIFIMRHPIAMALSQIKGEMDLEKEMVSHETLRCVYPDQYRHFHQYFENLTRQLDKFVAMWCMYHKLIIEHHFKNGGWNFIYYENLLMNPTEELQKVNTLWNLDLKIDRLDIRKASRSDFSNQLKQDPLEQLSKWKQAVSETDIRNVQSILDYFEIKIYHANNVLPVKSSLGA